MATMKVNGVDTLIASFEDIANLEENDVIEVLTPAAELFRDALVEAIKTRLKVHTGGLAASIQITPKKTKEGITSLVIGPKGNHPKTKKGVRRMKGKGKFNATNSEILYVLNYGSARIPAKHIVDNTLEEQREAVSEAIQTGFDEYMKKKGF